MANNHTSHKPSSIVKKVALSIVGVVIVTVATAFTLQKTIGPSVAAVQSAKEAIGVFTQRAPDYLGTTHYQKIDTPTNTTIRYRATQAHNYELYIEASATTQYVRDDASIKDNDASMITKYEKLLQQYGLKQTASNNSVTGYLTKLFENDKVACQTDDWQSQAKKPAAYGLACVDKTEVTKAYTDTDTLLAKATSDVNAADVRLVTTSVYNATSTKHIETLVTKQADGTSLSLYFLDTGKGWSYVGMRPTPSVDDKNSFTISDKLKNAIQASAEKDLLTTYILRGSM